MISQNGDIRAVNRTAHIQTACKGDTQLGRQSHIDKIFKEHIHGRFYRTGCIGSRCMAVNPSLGVYDIGNSGTCASDRKLVATTRLLPAQKILFHRCRLVFAVHHEFNVIPGGKPEVSIAILISNFTKFTNMGYAHKATTADSYSINFVAGFRYMN